MDDAKYGRLEEKIDKLVEKTDNTNMHLASLDKQMAVYNEQLKTHIEGVIQNRTAIKLLSETLMPIKSVYDSISFVVKTISWLASIGVISFLINYFGLF